MISGTAHDPQRLLEETNKEWDIFQYSYQFSMKDKIYFSTIRDKAIVDLCVNSLGDSANDMLAGDIKEEYRVNSTEAIERTQEELKYHVSNIMGPIDSVSIFSEGVEQADLWVNFQKAYEFNPTHSHGGIFSFVIYADIPEEIRQEHLNSYSNNSQCRGLIQFSSELTNNAIYLNPSKYTILVFESSHMHQVYPFYSNNTRISIAGNVHGG
jgi:hypothetical protein